MENINNELVDITETFSVSNFNYLEGRIWETGSNFFSIEIPISSFIIDSNTIETSLRFDRIILSDKLDFYIGTSIDFPINPEDGYIDGSIYMRAAHNPVDISKIKFVSLENNLLQVELTLDFLFDHEGIGFKNETIVHNFDIKLVEIIA